MSEALGRTLLHGISDFWLRFFSDSELLIKLHEVSLEAVGEAYQKMLMSLMRLHVGDTPLDERVPWRAFYAVDSFVIEVQAPDAAEDRWVVALDDVRSVALLHNVVLAPTKSLEVDFDFELIADDVERLAELNALNPRIPLTGWFLAFHKDPFSWDAVGDAVPGYGTTSISYNLPVKVTAADAAFDFTANQLGGQKILAGDTLRAVKPDGTVELSTVKSTVAGSLLLTDRTYLTKAEVLTTWSVGRNAPLYEDVVAPRLGEVAVQTVTSNVLSAWIPDAQMDHYSLYEVYGHPFSTSKTPSTEAYRAFVHGLWNLYVRGPSLQRLESAFNVVSGYPVIRVDGEVVSEVDRPAVGQVKVVTDEETYLFPNGTPVSARVLAAAATVDTEARGDLFTLFTDVTFLAAQENESFKDPGVLATDTLRIADGANPGDYAIHYFENTYIKIPNANAFPGAENGLTWSVVRNPGVGEIIVTGGTAGAVYKNSVVLLTTKAFDPLTAAYIVTDYIEDPDWWENSIIPPGLVDGLSADRRTVSPATYKNRIDNPSGRLFVGDVGFVVGEDDLSVQDTANGVRLVFDELLKDSAGVLTDFLAEGVDDTHQIRVTPIAGPAEVLNIQAVGKHWIWATAPAGGVPREGVTYDVTDPNNGDASLLAAPSTTGKLRYQPGERHLSSWLIMKNFLQWNMFTVIYDAELAPYRQDPTKILDLVLAAKPVYTYPYVEPYSFLTDTYPPPTEDDVTPRIKVDLAFEQATGVENRYYIGSRAIEWFDDTAADKDLVLKGAETGGILRLVDYDGVGVHRDVGITWASTYADTVTTTAFENRIRLIAGAPDALPVLSADGLSYEIYSAGDDPDVDPSTYAALTGRLLGGVGFNLGMLVGGMDTFIDRHELTNTNPNISGAPAIPTAVKNNVVADHEVGGVRVDNDITIDAVVQAIDLSSGLCHISDTPVLIKDLGPP